MCLPVHVRGVRSIMSSTFQAASILTREKPEWDVLREKMRYVMSEFHTGARWTDDAEYRVYAYSKVPMRKKAWRTLFGCKEVLQAEFRCTVISPDGSRNLTISLSAVPGCVSIQNAYGLRPARDIVNSRRGVAEPEAAM